MRKICTDCHTIDVGEHADRVRPPVPADMVGTLMPVFGYRGRVDQDYGR